MWLKPHIHVVDLYKHMGGWDHSKDAMGHEIKHRSTSMNSSFRPLRTRVFETSSIAIDTRFALAEALLFSRLFFNAAVWSQLTVRDLRALNHCYTKVIRSVMSATRVKHSDHSTDAFVLHGSQRPPPSKDSDCQIEVLLSPCTVRPLAAKVAFFIAMG